MHTVASEAFSQILFWASLACLPLGLGLFVLGFVVKQTGKALLAFIAGGLVVTHFCWYFQFGLSLSHVAGDLHPTFWSSSIPLGFGIACALGLISSLFRKEYTGGIF